MLSPDRAAALMSDPLTYDEVGATASSGPVPGYRWFERSVGLPRGAESFHRAVDDLFRWQVQLRAGLAVAASSRRVALGEVVVCRLGLGPLAVRAPCRVVHVIDESRRQGFGYGTLPGHAERGEEAFVVELRDDDAVLFTVRAFSRPASLLARASGPVGHGVQRFMTGRYLRALQP